MSSIKEIAIMLAGGALVGWVFWEFLFLMASV